MSHFSVAVLSHAPQDVETLLAPFDESTCNPAYVEFEAADESMEEIRWAFEREKKPGETLEDFVSRWYGYTYNAELDAWGYLCNPNAKWDWWELGGRWSNMLRLKAGRKGNRADRTCPNTKKPRKRSYCAQAQLKDIDFSPDPQAYNEALRFWEVVVEGRPLRKGEDPGQFRLHASREYYLKQFQDKEQYALACTSFTTWALVTPDGDWHESGTMGWFGTSNATPQSRSRYGEFLRSTLANADPEMWLSIVDCHI